MPSTEILVSFTLAALLMNLSPGPSNLYVMARSVSQGTIGGVVAALGLAAGSMCHVAATVLGLSALIKHSPTLFLTLKMAGALYLVYLGIKYWKATTPANDTDTANHRSLRSIFVESVYVEVTNPKTALFFLALLPQFVVPEAGAVAQQLLILGIIVTVSALPCDILVAVSSYKVAAWLNKHHQTQRTQERLSGSILVGMGSFIVAEEFIL